MLLKYVAAFVPWILLVSNAEPWIEASPTHMALAIVAIGAAHFAMLAIHRKLLSDHLRVPDLDEDQHGLFQADSVSGTNSRLTYVSAYPLVAVQSSNALTVLCHSTCMSGE